MNAFAISYATPTLAPVHPQPAAPSPSPGQRLLAVEFRTSDGRPWHAIGGGPTTTDAISSAHESCPREATWIAVRWNDLYGD